MNTIFPPKDLSLIHLPDVLPLLPMAKSLILLQNATSTNMVAAMIGTQAGLEVLDWRGCGALTVDFIP